MKKTVKFIQMYFIWLVDIILLFVVYSIALLLRFGELNFDGNDALYFTFLLLILLIFSFYNFSIGYNKDFLKRGLFREFVAVLKANSVLALVSVLVIFMLGWASRLSRLVILGAISANVFVMYLFHILFKNIVLKILSADGVAPGLVIVAQKGLMEETKEILGEKLERHYKIVEEKEIDEDSIHDVTEQLITVAFDEVFINLPEISQRKITTMISKFEDMGVIVHYNLDMPDVAEATSRVGSFGGYNVITYSMNDEEITGLFIKRTIDVLGGIVGMILATIIYLILAPIIKLDSPGPVLFSQIRVGRNGRRFKIYKFRSMYIDAEERKKELMEKNEMSGLMFKIEDDPRVTKVGKFIRKTSLDEFPQFWNVLRGEMSLVGTRPPTEKEFEQYNEHYRRRLSMTPGLTGMWQVSGRSDITDFEEVVKLDLKYIDNWSIGLDIKIILQTIAVVLFGKGAK